MQQAGANAVLVRVAWYAYYDVEYLAPSRGLSERGFDAPPIRLLNCRSRQNVTERPGLSEHPDPGVRRKSEAARLAVPAADEIFQRCAADFLDPLCGREHYPLATMAHSVLAATVDAYQASGAKLPIGLSERIKLSIVFLQGLPEGSLSPHFNGTAKLVPANGLDGRSGDLCSVELSLSPHSFDRNTLGSLPYVLFHEYNGRALQAPYVHDREIPSPASEYAEGWMDEAAWHVLLRHLAHPDAFSALLPCRFRADIFLDAAARTKAARIADAPNDYKLESVRARLRIGRRAATDVLSAFSEIAPDQGRDLFLSLSFALNVSDLTPTTRDRFVTDLAALVGKTKRFLSVRVLAMRGLDQWRSERDLGSLLRLVSFLSSGDETSFSMPR